MPQGSILGPLLFIIYINDLPEISKLAKFIFFADDASIIITGVDIAEIIHKLNSILPQLENWVNLNGLKMNLKKTKYMIFSNKPTEDIQITIASTNIERTIEERFLGVTMDSKLCWTAHRQKLASKLSRNAGILHMLRGIVPLNVIKTLYSSFIQSHLFYCPTVWGLGSKSSLDRIFSAQKKAIRTTLANSVNYYYDSQTGKLPEHTKPIFNNNNMLTVHNIIYMQTLALLQKVHNNIAPIMIRNLFEVSTQANPTKIRAVKEETFFKVPKTNKKALDNTIFVKGPKIFNKTATEFNRSLKINNQKKLSEPLFQNKFTDPFKRSIKHTILNSQNSNNTNEWHIENFPMYTHVQN